MALDLEAIKRKIAAMSGQGRTSNVQLWKPQVGDYKVRGVHWKNPDPAMPLAERWFYYIGKERGFLQPKQFGKEDPIDNLIKKLYSSGKPEEREMAKALRAKMSGYMAVIVRGQEDKGVQVWKFPPTVSQKLLTFWVDTEKNEDQVDIFDPDQGFDIRVTVTEKTGANGKYLAADPDLARRPSKLSDDEAQTKKWLEGVPNIDDMYQQKSTQEIETVLNNWLNEDKDNASKSDGTTKGSAKSNDELDALADEVKQSKPAAKKATAAATGSSKSKDLDEAFAELSRED